MFRYLKFGLSVVLVFIGVKMLLDPHDQRAAVVSSRNSRPAVSLLVVAAILAIAIALSVTAARRDKLKR